MRVLFNDEDGTVCVIKVTEMGYDPDVLDNKKGGLYFYDTCGDFYGIEDVDKFVCEGLCKRLFETGICDLRDFGKAVIYS